MINGIANTHNLKINATSWNNKLHTRISKKHGTEGPGQQSNNEGTGASKKNKSVQKTKPKPKKQQSKKRFQATKINQSEVTLKTKEKPSKKTAIHGQTMKTKRYPPYKPNHIGDHTNQLARTKHHGVSQEKNNTPFWI